MDRRNSIRLIIASAVAPMFVAEGLMKIKPIVVPELFIPNDHQLDLMRYVTMYQNQYNNYSYLVLRGIKNDLRSLKPFMCI